MVKTKPFVLPISSVQWRRPHAKLQAPSSRVEARAWTGHKHSWIWRYLRQHRGLKEGSQYCHYPFWDLGGTATIDSWQLTVDDQWLIFQIRSQLNPLPANRGEPQPCMRGCGDIQDNCHIIQCHGLDREDQGDYNLLINGNMHEMKTNLEQWQKIW